MSQKPADPTIAPQIELVIRRLDSLSTLPCVAAQLFSKLLHAQPSAISDIIESDPALTAKIFSLIHHHGLFLPDEKFSLRRALDELPVQLVRDALFSVKVYQPFDTDDDGDLQRKQLVLHSLAVGCCAEDIAEIISPKVDSQLAYLAGLLHDIGKLALEETMPRSFTGIAEQAKSQSVSTCTIEQKHLGTDHTILGKRLAGKWHLPNQITLAIWLHHSNTDTISQSMPEAGIAQIVQLADSIAHQCGIGQSGSYDAPGSADKIAQSLEITPEQLEQIRASLAEKVAEKSKALNLDAPNAAKHCCEVVHTAAVQLIRDNSKLSLENLQLQTTSNHFDFMTDFLSSIDSNSSPIDAAENFAVRWQKFFQTGPVCLYLTEPVGSQHLQAVIVESSSQIKTVILNTPAETPPIPKALTNHFAILDAHDSIDWLFEQLDVEFDLNRTKLVPLLCGPKAVGAIVFEFHHPIEAEQLQEKLKAATSIAGAVLDICFASLNQQRFAERFAQLVAVPKDTQPRAAGDNSLVALAEMAAGAAHELNNPLSVISGRSQILAEAETDPEKKRMLEQVRENAGELSAIIEDLMTFAEPPKPRPTETDINRMLDEATQLATQKQNAEEIDVQIEAAEGLENVFVDSAQIVSAVANVFCNCLESYTDGRGPIKVTAGPGESGDFVKLSIEDFGCGMDTETIQKATQPFFSAKPAGRKRGMGLAHAARLVQSNNGSLNITSQPASGTTVTILLPCK